MKVYIDTMIDSSEFVHYDTPGIPLYIRKGSLSSYIGKRAVCHWHDDIELILILEGEMNYYINGQTILLKEHDGILINTRQMHYGYSSNDKECIFICILFHPSLLSSSKHLTEKYITPLLTDVDFEYSYFEKEAHEIIINYINTLLALKESNSPAYELKAVGILYLLWSEVITIHSKSYHSFNNNNDDVELIRKMISYIHENYSEKITLQQIAASGNICKSKCCNVFKEQVHMSPFDFLNYYRIQLAADMLISTKKSITDISISCGFQHLSYFSKLFYRYLNCTPTEYKQNYKK